MKRFLNIILAACISITATATSYERLAARMNDHFEHAEWLEVLQETDAMIKINPIDADPYAAALIAAQFLNDLPAENKYLSQSQYNRVHIDSLLQHVYVRTKHLHNAKVYEDLLLNLKANNKGLARVFNIYLLDFYSFARKTHETIAIADELLKSTPENLRFRKLKADALFYQGDSEEAIKMYESIIQSDPTDYDVMTILSAYYTTQADKCIEQLYNEYTSTPTPDNAYYTRQMQVIMDSLVTPSLILLHQADSIRPSEYIKKEITRMQNITCHPPLHPSTRRNSILDILKKED